MQQPLIDIRSLSVCYPEAKKIVLHDVNLTINPGEIICVIGESGSGKSTLLNAIMQLPGQVEITKGQVIFDGADIKTMSSGKLQTIRGSRMGVVFQEPGASLNPIRKISKQFYDVLKAHNPSVTKEHAWEKACEMLNSMSLDNPERILESCPSQLSGGMNQRVAIALAMVLKPDILLADEPTSALDVTTQAQIVKQMMELRKNYGTSIILVTHNVGVAAYMADRMVVMKQGKIVDQGTREQVLHHPKSAYTKRLLAAVPEMEE